MARRKYRPVAETYVTEWLGLTYPPGTWMTNVPLGTAKVWVERPVYPKEVRALTKPFRPVCDALVLLEDEVHIIEAKVRDDRGKIEQLLIYRYLFPRTPEFREHWHKRIRTILLTPKPMGEFEKFLEKYEIEVVYYCPPWLKEYLDEIDRKYRRGIYYSTEF